MFSIVFVDSMILFFYFLNMTFLFITHSIMVSCKVFFEPNSLCVPKFSILILKRVLILKVSAKFTWLRNYNYVFGELDYITPSFVISKPFLIFSNFCFSYPIFWKLYGNLGVCLMVSWEYQKFKYRKSNIILRETLNADFGRKYQNNKNIEFYGNKIFESPVWQNYKLFYKV